MPYAGETPMSHHREQSQKRRAYEAKLTSKGVKPRSSKVLELMHRKFK